MSNPYIRYVKSATSHYLFPTDLYRIFEAYKVESIPIAHAIKKLMLPGQRGHKSRLQDLEEAKIAIEQAIEIERGNAIEERLSTAFGFDVPSS